MKEIAIFNILLSPSKVLCGQFSLILYSSCASSQELYKNLNMSISPNLELEDSLLFVGKLVLFTLSNDIVLQIILFYQKLYLVWFSYRSISHRIS